MFSGLLKSSTGFSWILGIPAYVSALKERLKEETEGHQKQVPVASSRCDILMHRNSQTAAM